MAFGPLRLMPDDAAAADADGVYVDGRSTYAFTASATDGGVGMREIGAVLEGHATFATTVRCDPADEPRAPGKRICPGAASTPVAFDLAGLAEGEHRVHGFTVDRAHNRGQSPSWPLYVDRTAPPAAEDFDADFDYETHDIDVFWTADDDPDLRDGSRGSGTWLQLARAWHPRSGRSDWALVDETIRVADYIDG